jgi:small multidrug resistance pump
VLTWLLLMVAIGVEVAATASLKRADGFTNLRWSLAVVLAYSISIWLPTRVVRHLPVSITYAIWAGSGTAAIAIVGSLFLHEDLGSLRILGLILIIAGVVLVNLSRTTH